MKKEVISWQTLETEIHKHKYESDYFTVLNYHEIDQLSIELLLKIT